MARAQIDPRWEVRISGAETTEMADLRIDEHGGRILLQFSDSAFVPLRALRLAGDRVDFMVPRGRLVFQGTVHGSTMEGTMRDSLGRNFEWRAVAISVQDTHWPIPPRLVFRQLETGGTNAVEKIPLRWIGMSDSAANRAQLRALSASTRIPFTSSAAKDGRAALIVLGLDESARQSVRDIFTRISASADPEFRALFSRDGRPTIDIHDQLLHEAPHFLFGFQLSRAGDALRAVGELSGDVTDSLSIRQATWRFWSGFASEKAEHAAIDSLTKRDETSAASLRAVVAGFDESLAWWRRAVHWLLTHPWLQTAAGARSPAQLMAQFWGVDSLPLPEIETRRFGDAAALPTLAFAHAAPWLARADNASAVEWFARGGMRDAFKVWRALRWGELPLTVVDGGRSATLSSPAAQADVHPAATFGDHDAVVLDPGIMPLAAVATFLHEWNHLLAGQARLRGPTPLAIQPSATSVRIREDDPWLAEGFAEWATEAVLQPAGASADFLRFTQGAKRAEIAARDPNDPHVLGLQLVRHATSGRSNSALRQLLINDLDNLDHFARDAGFPARGAGPLLTLQRPATAVVIPEISFTWLDGDAWNLSRRFLVPTTRSEH